MAGEGRLELVGDALLQAGKVGRADLAEEGEQQPAAHAPRHAEGAVELGRAAVKASVQVHLLVRRRAVPAVFLGGAVEGGFHRRQDLAAELAAAGGVEAQRGAGRDDGLRQVFHEGGRRRIAHVLGADRSQQRLLLRPAHDVDQAYAVLDADLVEHQAEVGCGGRMHKGGVAFAPHRLDHAERGQRVDEARCAFGRGRAVG